MRALQVAVVSHQTFDAVREARRHLAVVVGCTRTEPVMKIGFSPLPVIPHLKITDRGMFDVDGFRLVEG